MRSALPFENDVKMYGIQTGHRESQERREFENDVKMYGIQTVLEGIVQNSGLRMM